MGRFMAVCLSFVLCSSLFLIGCSQDQSKETVKKSEDATQESIVTDPGTFPIVKDKVTLRVMVGALPFIENYETNEFTKWYEEKTNVHIEWEIVPLKSIQEKLNIALNSGDYPDIIMNMEVSPTQMMIYGNQGVFLPLNDLIEKYGVETKKMFEQMPMVKDALAAPDGNIYSLPDVNDCYHCTMQYKMWIYQPWLDKLRLKMPATTEEFYQVLKAFKEQDPNGNGKADEIPLAGATVNGGIINAGADTIEKFLMNPFIYNDYYTRMLLNEGEIDVVFNKPEWKEGLSYLHKLYAEGLLAPESFTQDIAQLKQMGENPNVPILGAAPAKYTGRFTELLGESGRWADYKAVPPLKGPNGAQYATYYPDPTRPGKLIITNATKHPDVAFRWADAFFSEEITLLSNYGREDQEWRRGKEGEIGINGEPAKYVDNNAYGKAQNIHWSSTAPYLKTNDFRLSWASVHQPDNEVILYEATKQYEQYTPEVSQVLPKLFFTDEQSSELADLEMTINGYVDQMFARFITGDANLEKEWDTYLDTLQGMNVNRYIEIYQEAYDAKYKK
ncbi:ABC transporter substrate-binding protein [Ammoniphilus resinae]|uniref:Aldouronate transport system substrate-binding protein n=1 Tax=Ammoniphilus resinae TaxID=861532 RepID=A0ABS4GSP3_9BACL|nr:ABC transporter substrate-binding protein [Ammoniphilus resinae]MBP1933298.1 putative aldouronate transport system substrate-binding protein [Ammoniphilus resinae]